MNSSSVDSRASSLHDLPTSDGVKLEPIFVFGSNLAGRHGRGAAYHARIHCGAIYGKGEGLQGSSYAIPTKDERLRTLPLARIEEHVRKFLDFARVCHLTSFRLTPIGCGLAGYKPKHIAPMFADAPPNVIIPDEFKPFLSTRSPSQLAAPLSVAAHLAPGGTPQSKAQNNE